MSPSPRKWRREPSDGTSYSYWASCDGWIIETKKRFLPAIGYTLGAPAATFADRWPIKFATLREAQAAADWPREILITAMRREYTGWVSFFAFGQCALSRIHEHALEEDADRTAQRARGTE